MERFKCHLGARYSSTPNTTPELVKRALSYLEAKGERPHSNLTHPTRKETTRFNKLSLLFAELNPTIKSGTGDPNDFASWLFRFKKAQ